MATPGLFRAQSLHHCKSLFKLLASFQRMAGHLVPFTTELALPQGQTLEILIEINIMKRNCSGALEQEVVTLRSLFLS